MMQEMEMRRYMQHKEGKRFDFRFLVVLFVVLFKYIKLEQTINDIYTYVLLFILLAMTFIYLVVNNINKVNIKWFSYILFMSLYLGVLYRDVNILLPFIVSLLFLTDNNPVYKIVKYYLISLSIAFFGTVLCGYLGILESAKLSRVVGNIYIQRNSLGFSHPNTAFLYFFYIILGYYYISKNTKLFFIVTIISSFIVYKMTLCRTGFICIIIFLLSVLILSKLKKMRIIRYLFPILFIFTLILAYKFGDYNSFLNQLSSNRLYLWKYYISNHLVFNISGNKLVPSYIIDNLYLNIILSFGIVGLILYVIMYYFSGRNVEKNIKLSIIFNIVLIYGIFETHTINSGINFLITIQILYLISMNNVLSEVS